MCSESWVRIGSSRKFRRLIVRNFSSSQHIWLKKQHKLRSSWPTTRSISQRDEPISIGFLKLLSVKGCWLIITEITCVTIKPEQWSWLISPYTKRVARRKQEWMQSKATASYDESAPSWNIWMCFITDISNTDQLYIICIRSQNEMPVCKPWQGHVWALRSQSLGPETKKWSWGKTLNMCSIGYYS